MEDKRVRWMLLTAIAPIAWGSTYFVTRHLLPADAALWGSVIRCLPAGLLVLAFARQLPRGSWWWRSVVLGMLNVGGFSVLIYIVGQRIPTSLAAALMSTSAAAMMLFAWLLLRQRPRAAAVLGAGVGIVGVVLMLGPGAGPVDMWGVVASLGAMLASSVGFVLTTRWGSDVPPLAMTAWQLIAGALVVLPFAIVVEGAPPALDGGAIAGFIYIIVIATALAYGAWFTGLSRLPASVVGIIGLLNPVTGAVLGVVWGGEAFGIAQAVGLALVIVGVLWGSLPPRVASRRLSTS
ncbi:putative blue pigment (indigoidine) exporter [Microbacterium endophyticum]|uniref:Putative blue pigment (Indigoidine) exporter n=1 Tax=Microbacterium endophyticum TaxID=1526412 RepID=A0A7W4V189_9MICO|nr:EamA family transporter [Microbacterium endophyticum]MBB2975002.1 putative blue pigment (indigoidine) exporter [Microbacterium endophyticum]NIK37458.1 putative blue pigment (indigoidine) exporter [Microbacterium endophyticum]